MKDCCFLTFPLDIRRLRGDLNLTFRLFAENQASSFFTLAGESSLRGHNKQILKPHCPNLDSLTIFSVLVIQPWNSLPQDVVCTSSLACFKTRLDTFLGLVDEFFFLLVLPLPVLYIYIYIYIYIIYIYIYIYILAYNVRVHCYTISFCICFLQVNSGPDHRKIQ